MPWDMLGICQWKRMNNFTRNVIMTKKEKRIYEYILHVAQDNYHILESEEEYL